MNHSKIACCLVYSFWHRRSIYIKVWRSVRICISQTVSTNGNECSPCCTECRTDGSNTIKMENRFTRAIGLKVRVRDHFMWPSLVRDFNCEPAHFPPHRIPPMYVSSFCQLNQRTSLPLLLEVSSRRATVIRPCSSIGYYFRLLGAVVHEPLEIYSNSNRIQ